jgi:prepilin-type N-terminal cleavage/methylation domain-containing protein
MLIGGATMFNRRERDRGFTLVELAIVLAGFATLTAISVPGINAFLSAQRARNGARTVERTLQNARLKAVTSSRSLRVRFTCPTTGTLRILELTGVAGTDNAGNRCDPTAYPFPAPIDTLRSTPSLDSPVILLPRGTAVAGNPTMLEFTPRGTVFAVGSGGAVTPLAADVVWTVTQGSYVNTVTINALGRVRLN